MNLSNVAKHFLYLAKNEYGSENSATATDQMFAAERLFEVLKSSKNSYFNELYTYDTLEFNDEYDEMTDEEESNDEIDDYNENEHSDIKNRFTLEEMENIIEWVDQHPNAGLATISHRFKKAGKWCINTFKRDNGISSRRYKKIITRTKPNRKLCSLNDTQNWIESKRTLISKYSSHQILNSDHCSFQQEYVPPRTLSFTVQPVTSANDHLLDKFLLILQEKENTFVLRPLVGKKFLLFLDAWKTQADLTKFRAVFPNQDSQLLIFPEGSTGYIQPQDLSLFCSW
ncbi:unnamed protein product [Rotaria sp. Silwood1]|nr:unnamed protein product [Rotaria sp. Silwood1]